MNEIRYPVGSIALHNDASKQFLIWAQNESQFPFDYNPDAPTPI